MIRKSIIMFDAHSQTSGIREVRLAGTELLGEAGPLQVASSLFCRLGFRLRVGTRAVFDVGGVVRARIVVMNSVGIPDYEAEQTLLGPVHNVRAEMASDVLITLTPRKLDEEKKAAIGEALNGPDYSKTTPLYVPPEDAVKPLNLLLVAYRVISGEKIQFNRVQRVLRKDVHGGHTYEVHVLKRPHDPVDCEQIEDCVKDATPTSPIPFQVGGALYDLASEIVAKLQQELAKSRGYAFYSLALQAQDYIRQTDYLNALLYSVIAFENAHAELVEHVAETKAGCIAVRKWVQELLRQAGISALVRLTPSLFMEPQNRPSQAIVDGVVRAINIRNELAHAKRDSAGNLKVERHTSQDLLPLMDAVFAYMNAIARQLPE